MQQPASGRSNGQVAFTPSQPRLPKGSAKSLSRLLRCASLPERIHSRAIACAVTASVQQVCAKGRSMKDPVITQARGIFSLVCGVRLSINANSHRVSDLLTNAEGIPALELHNRQRRGADRGGSAATTPSARHGSRVHSKSVRLRSQGANDLVRRVFARFQRGPKVRTDSARQRIDRFRDGGAIHRPVASARQGEYAPLDTGVPLHNVPCQTRGSLLWPSLSSLRR
jgi:hypothetical protein